MDERETHDHPAEIHEDPKVSPAGWVIRLVVALLAVVVGLLLWQLAASFMPRWWAQQVGNRVDGEFLPGLGGGLAIGFVFTFVPLLLFFQVRRRFLSWTWRAILAVVAVVIALPNWLTLTIVMGSSDAAHAGDRILDVDAPWFRGGSLIGAVAGGLLAVLLSGTAMWMGHRRKQVRTLKAEVAEHRNREKAQNDNA